MRIAFDKGYLKCEKIESKQLLLSLLSQCKNGCSYVEGYEEKHHFLIKFFNTCPKDINYGIGVSCQHIGAIEPQIVIVPHKDMIILCFDNKTLFYVVEDKKLREDFVHYSESVIYSTFLHDEKDLIIIYETGIDIIDINSKKIKSISTDIITDFSIDKSTITISDFEGLTKIIPL